MASSVRNVLTDIAYSYVLPHALTAVAKLDIAAMLSAGPRSAEQIAKEHQFDAPSLKRVLLLLAQYNIFKIDEEEQFSLTPLSELLLSSADSVRDNIIFIHDLFSKSLNSIDLTIQTGEPSFNTVFNDDFFSYLKKHPLDQERFNKGMANYSAYEDNIISQAVPYAKYPVVVDVGGGQGGLLFHILRKNSNITGVLCDIATQPIPADLKKRCTFQECDFFRTFSVKGDLYILKRIIHDWDDQQSLSILNNVHQTMPSHAKLLIIDTVMKKDTPIFKYVEDVLIMSVLKGKERTEQEFHALIDKSPFEIESILNTDSLLNIIVLQPKP